MRALSKPRGVACPHLAEGGGDPAYQPQVRRWAGGVARGFGVLAFAGPRVTAVFPNHELELGQRDPEAAYVFGYLQTAEGPAPAVQIRGTDGVMRRVAGRPTAAIGAFGRA